VSDSSAQVRLGRPFVLPGGFSNGAATSDGTSHLSCRPLMITCTEIGGGLRVLADVSNVAVILNHRRHGPGGARYHAVRD